MNVFITGGAGFIGTNLTRRLLKEGCRVTVYDNFCKQIHGSSTELPDDIKNHVELIKGDIRDNDTLCKNLKNHDAVVHLAAETGTGQSMYEVHRYTDINVNGTARLMDYLVNNKTHGIQKVIVASSRAIYGEGKYICPIHNQVYPHARKTEDMKRGQFEPVCPECHEKCVPAPTDEYTSFAPSSLYGLTKQVQEQMVLMFARTLGLSAFALRYQNVYGPGQSLKNPYTGILAIFANLARTGEPVNIFEDGFESRDFVYIDDVVETTWLCLRKEGLSIDSVNVGSGKPTTVLDVVNYIFDYFKSKSVYRVTGAFREGDIRHCYADLAKAHALLGFQPKWDFKDGIKEFLKWAEQQPQAENAYQQSLQEMNQKGLLHG